MVRVVFIIFGIIGIALLSAWFSRAPEPAGTVPTNDTSEALPVTSTTPAPNSTQADDSRLVPVLTMSGQGLVGVPMTIFDHTELVAVDLSHNKLTGALPAEVRHLQKLEKLDLSYNEFTGVPAEIGQLSHLRYLDLSYNQLTGLPYELGNLQALEFLDLRGNQVSTHDLAVIKEQLPKTVVIETGE